jgi:hypothetical protein
VRFFDLAKEVSFAETFSSEEGEAKCGRSADC